jgi:dihydropteroate synthase
LLWRCRHLAFDLRDRVLVMGIINLTPDSFSDGGRYLEPKAGAEHGLRLLSEGADLLDLGAESTRPGAMPVSAAEQLRRLLPVLEPLAREPGVCISVDTANAEVATVALETGAHAINDVTALADPAMAGLIARFQAGVVLMHMRGKPATMQDTPSYEDVAREVRAELKERMGRAQSAGIGAEQIAIDPGIGFGKTARHNLELVARVDELLPLGRPVMVGVSRKSFLGKVLDLPVDQRLEGALSATAVAVHLGARIVRTHDVAATVRAVRVAAELREARRQ